MIDIDAIIVVLTKQMKRLIRTAVDDGIVSGPEEMLEELKWLGITGHDGWDDCLTERRLYTLQTR